MSIRKSRLKSKIIITRKDAFIYSLMLIIFSVFLTSAIFYNCFMKPDSERISMLTDSLINFNNDSNTEFVRNYINENMTIKQLGVYCNDHIGKCQMAIGMAISGICGVQ